MVKFCLPIAGLFSKKLQLFVNGRKNVFTLVSNTFNEQDKILWFHAASLGEFEQGRPIIEACKDRLPDHKILLTFFSPSGYEIRKNYQKADLVTYLPLDTKRNMRRFLSLVKPKMAVIIKYEFWPNLLGQLENNKTPAILVSGIFRENQVFFKSYGGFMRKPLRAFQHLFVQDETSKRLLENIAIEKVTVSGDTRFDRVYQISKEEINLPVLEQFSTGKLTVIAGSTWPKDEELLFDFINNDNNDEVNFIIAPHETDDSHIESITSKISKKTSAYSKASVKNITDFKVIVIDGIGLLSKIYRYGDIAYIGGGFGSGIHNVLEPATYGIPVIIGPNYKKFNEAIDLIASGACIPINNKKAFDCVLNNLITNEISIKEKGKKARCYVESKIGATQAIIQYICPILEKK